MVKVCRFWQATGECRYGQDCRFLHVDPAAAIVAAPADELPPKLHHSAVVTESSSRQRHSASSFQRVWRPSVDSSESKPPPPPSNQPQRLPQHRPRPAKVTMISQRDQELAQLRRRFTETFSLTTLLAAGCNDQRISIALKPTDPDFPFDLTALNLEFSIPADYPATAPCGFHVNNPEIPPLLRLRIERYCNKQAVETLLKTGDATAASGGGCRITLLQLLIQRLDRDLERLLVGTVDGEVEVGDGGVVEAKTAEGVSIKLLGRVKAPVKLITLPAAAEIAGDKENSDESETLSDNDSEDTATDGNDSESVLLDRPPPPQQQQQQNQQPHGTQIRLMDVHCRNIGVLECSLLGLLIECKRCRTRIELPSIRPYADQSTQCEKCKTMLRLRFTPTLAHLINDFTVGTVDTDQCQVLEMLRSTFLPTCSECTPDTTTATTTTTTTTDDDDDVVAVAVVVKQLELQAHPCMPPLIKAFSCVQCHSKLEFGFGGVRCTRLGLQAGLFSTLSQQQQATSMRKKKKKQQKEPGIVPGQPLPSKGTCEHYRKSYRWLRFPCCGRAYPCDKCHEEQAKDGHEMKQATRMVCGFCSREQRLVGSTVNCSHCGADVVRSAGGSGAGYWEGGSGTRDQVRMSRNDSRKFRGLHKTASKKSERVGQKGKRNTQQH